mmetsp:Transcript_7599/g.28653  ORF Transcript_7599/g.28653 Transcript_7599/m.28653 type:complete len:330 (-) Transcript_7599:23-1012(-)
MRVVRREHHRSLRGAAAELGGKLLLQRFLQRLHLLLLSMHEHDELRPKRFDELAVLVAVDMRSEGDRVHGCVKRLYQAVQAGDLLRPVLDASRQRPGHSIAGDHDRVLLVIAPRFEQLPTHAGLKHPRRRQHHRRSRKLAHVHSVGLGALDLAHEAQVEGIAHIHAPANVQVHHVDVRPADSQRLTTRPTAEVHRHGVEALVVAPELVQHQQQLLSEAQGEDRDEAFALVADGVLHFVRELLLAAALVLVRLDAKGGLHDEHIRGEARHLGPHEVAILFAAVVPSVQDADAADLQHEHGSAQHVPGIIAPEPNAIHLLDTVVVQEVHFP